LSKKRAQALDGAGRAIETDDEGNVVDA